MRQEIRTVFSSNHTTTHISHLLFPKLDHRLTRHVLGVIEALKCLGTSSTDSHQFWHESMVQFSSLSLLPFYTLFHSSLMKFSRVFMISSTWKELVTPRKRAEVNQCSVNLVIKEGEIQDPCQVILRISFQCQDEPFLLAAHPA